jgi:hypothetical protein
MSAFGKIAGGFLIAKGGSDIASSQKEQGREARRRGYEQQAFNEVAAGQMIAVGQHAAREESRQAEIIASRAVAVAAAGGSVMDITHLIADIYGEGAYRASVIMHDAREAAERLKFEGVQAVTFGEGVEAAKRKEAKGTKMATIGQLFSMAGSYGGSN